MDIVSGTLYFHGQKICCGNTLRDITPDLQCCNRQHFYNETTETCCGAEVVDKSEGKLILWVFEYFYWCKYICEPRLKGTAKFNILVGIKSS